MHLSSISRLFAIRMTKSVETFAFYTPGEAMQEMAEVIQLLEY